ncbi:CAP domain-containing protein [Deinococcus soli (ex Cha et al. 2016)]|uniref:Uncharacterized protein YkwD n=2 Tax=Deinococcus soli (ex Cha et al. 2016) TaxID=1309411 RepID=A0AAE3XCT2_9DEIO|nr:CAP domain-containing protein [Deinococcus soli (ex Cha et al. 2016)]MDR6219042.1 uncharacterized protein YkwD [Deinococcus soli (ex Cha et al. 2016)]MDR6328839.1 uncharacterized protein YkwD [Deinococcus soli (ex Cha et al. 2016)]MDR6751673.1 uncharacterized protein YkwD [Deinococcus soli (ex Cha et al. 2016)]
MKGTLSRFALTVTLLSSGGNAQSGTPPSDATGVIIQTLQACGVTARPSAALGRAASLFASGQSLQAAVDGAGYSARALKAIKAGTAATLARTLTQDCVQYQGLDEYGISVGVNQGAGAVALLVGSPKVPASLQDARTEGQRVVALTNAVRARGATCGGVVMPPAGPLTWDEQLFQAADYYARRQAYYNFTGHTDKYDGTDPGQRIAAFGFKGGGWGENLGYGQQNAAAVVQGWLDSPGHCKNLMNPAFNLLGASVATNPATEYGIYWTQEFGIRR